MAAELNDAQRAAVERLSGRLLITAGAGSGKTRTLAERFAHAVHISRGHGSAGEVDAILTITYTEKAAGELADRVRDALRSRGLVPEARAVDGAWISTIHTFCARVLRREALVAGVDPGFVIADEVDAAELSMEAFERTAGARLDSGCAGTARLFELYGYGELRTAVFSVARTLHARGISAADVVLDDRDDIVAIIREATELFSFAGECFVAYTGTASSPAAHQEACCTMIEQLACVTDQDDEATPEHVWRLLLGYGASKRSTKCTKDAVDHLMKARDDLADRCACIMTRALAEIFLGLVEEYSTRFQEYKRLRGMFDFDDLIITTRDLFERNPDILDRYRDRFELVMVDEFQDTDAVQLAFIEAVGAPDLATVGDVRQSIYSFRGADVDVYRGHREDMLAAGAEKIGLVENFRSHVDIIEFVNRTFGTETFFGAHDEGLVAKRGEPEMPRIPAGEPRVEIILVDTSDGVTGADALQVEAAATAERFARLRERGFEAHEMAVLLRQYAHAPVFAKALARLGFDTTIVGGDRYFELHEVAAARALCAVLANPHDDEALARVLVSDLVGLDNDSLVRLSVGFDGHRREGSLWEALCDPGRRSPGAHEVIATVVTTIERARHLVGTMSLATVLSRAVEELGFDDLCISRGVEGRLARANMQQLCRKAAAFEQAGGAGPAAFCAVLDAEEASGLRQSAATTVGEGGSVMLMSIHAAKGLEFPVVAVPTLGKTMPGRQKARAMIAVEDGRASLSLSLPKSFAPANKEAFAMPRQFARIAEMRLEQECAEAKRVFYVACTRAQEALVLVGSGAFDALLDARKESPLEWLVRAHGPSVLESCRGAGTEASTAIGDARVRVEVVVPDGLGEYYGAREPGDMCSGAGVRTWKVAPSATEEPRPSRPERISYSDVDLYRRCSLRYWAERIAGMTQPPDPRQDGSPRAFGSALHASLQLAVGTGGVPSAERRAAISRVFQLSPDQAGRLATTLDTYLGSRTARELLSVGEQLDAEVPFAIRLGGEGAPLLVGAIDAYVLDGDRALVVDYKSGPGDTDCDRGTSGGDAADGDCYGLQAECYALVALRDGAERVTVRFVFPEAYDEAGEPRVIAFEYTGADHDRIEAALLETWERMGCEQYRDIGVWRHDTCSGCPASGSMCRLTSP